LLKLANYKYSVEYKKGKDKIVADGLSRRKAVKNSYLLVIIAIDAS